MTTEKILEKNSGILGFHLELNSSIFSVHTTHLVIW